MSPRPQTGHLRVSALPMSIELEGVAVIGAILSRRTGLLPKCNHRDGGRYSLVRCGRGRGEARRGRARLRDEIRQVAHRGDLDRDDAALVELFLARPGQPA